MVKLSFIRDDIKLSGGQFFDDQKISDAQLEMWILGWGDVLCRNHLAQQTPWDQGRSGFFLRTFVQNILLDDTGEFTDGNPLCRKYIALPQSIYDFHSDAGVDYMCYYGGTTPCTNCPPPFTKIMFTRTTPMLMNAIGRTEYERATPKNPYFYREQDRLWLLGLETSPLAFVSKVELGLLTTLPSFLSVDPDDDLRIPEHLLPLVKRYVLEEVRINLGLPGTKLINDATENPEMVKPLGPLQSVNDENLNITQG